MSSQVAAARRIAAFAQTAPELPASAVRAAKHHFLDALGVGLAAFAMRQRPRIEAAVCALGAANEATGLGLTASLPAPSAALLNGSLMHALEFDDTHMGSVMHGSAVLAPVALALTERDGRSGAELLRSFALGWEVLARAGLVAPNRFQAQGFHGTPVAGAIAAAFVAAMLLRLDEDRTVAAMGIAGSQSAGLFEFLSNGSTVKMLHGGWPAFSGIVAAELAAAEMTGPETVFEGSRGLFASFARAPEAGDAFIYQLADLGDRWLLPETALKPWPTCHYIQAALECAERLVSAGVRAEDIEAVDVQVPGEVAWLICEPWEEKRSPPTGYVAKHSLPYCVAAIFLDGGVTPATFDRIAPDPRLVAFAQRIEWQPLEDSGFPRRYPARVEVRTSAGGRRVEEVRDVLGSPGRPMSDAQIRAKFRANAETCLSSESADRVFDLVDRMEQLPHLGELSAALRSLRHL